jgi:hypothetical protein
MADNPWGTPEGSPDETRQQWVTPAPAGGPQWSPQQPPQYPQPSGSGGRGGLIAAVIAAVIVVVLVILALWYFVFRDDGDDTAAEPTGANFTTSVPTEESTVVTETVTATPEPAPEPTPGAAPSSGNGGSGSSSRPAGLTGSGWSGHPDAQCNVSEDSWVYAARNSGTWVTVCRSASSGGLYYRGERNGDGYEEDVDMSSSDVSRGYFSVPASPSRIIINGDHLEVRDSSGAVKAREDFDDVSRG